MPRRDRSRAHGCGRHHDLCDYPRINRRGEVLRAIKSVVDQSLPPDEIIVVADASRDGRADVVAELRDSRIHILCHAQNRGAAAARNTGIEAARSSWIAFLDSDDEWMPHKLAVQMEALSHAPA